MTSSMRWFLRWFMKPPTDQHTLCFYLVCSSRQPILGKRTNCMQGPVGFLVRRILKHLESLVTHFETRFGKSLGEHFSFGLGWFQIDICRGGLHWSFRDLGENTEWKFPETLLKNSYLSESWLWALNCWLSMDLLQFIYLSFGGCVPWLFLIPKGISQGIWKSGVLFLLGTFADSCV